MKRLYALRGAARCLNQADDIQTQVSLLYDEILARNNINEDDIVSFVFSITPDLDAVNPAAALRKAGRAPNLALFCVQEAHTGDALERVVRVLIHYYAEEGSAARPVYRNGAEVLRPDRSSH